MGFGGVAAAGDAGELFAADVAAPPLGCPVGFCGVVAVVLRMGVVRRIVVCASSGVCEATSKSSRGSTRFSDDRRFRGDKLKERFIRELIGSNASRQFWVNEKTALLEHKQPNGAAC